MYRPVLYFNIYYKLFKHLNTHLSLRTTPSIQAPNSTTLDMSGIKTIKEYVVIT